jgi:hypothetical protein
LLDFKHVFVELLMQLLVRVVNHELFHTGILAIDKYKYRQQNFSSYLLLSKISNP